MFYIKSSVSSNSRSITLITPSN